MKTLIVLLIAASLSAQQNGGNSQADHHSGEMQKRGESTSGMGFSQTATTHHFLLTANGGIIQVTANDPADKQTIEQIRNHLEHIAGMFSAGDFSIPHFVHNREVPGVKTMKREKAHITYAPEQVASGERIVIDTSSDTALRAIHDFLRFQIRDHQTGDPLRAVTH